MWWGVWGGCNGYFAYLVVDLRWCGPTTRRLVGLGLTALGCVQLTTSPLRLPLVRIPRGGLALAVGVAYRVWSGRGGSCC